MVVVGKVIVVVSKRLAQYLRHGCFEPQWTGCRNGAVTAAMAAVRALVFSLSFSLFLSLSLSTWKRIEKDKAIEKDIPPAIGFEWPWSEGRNARDERSWLGRRISSFLLFFCSGYVHRETRAQMVREGEGANGE